MKKKKFKTMAKVYGEQPYHNLLKSDVRGNYKVKLKLKGTEPITDDVMHKTKDEPTVQGFIYWGDFDRPSWYIKLYYWVINIPFSIRRFFWRVFIWHSWFQFNADPPRRIGTFEKEWGIKPMKMKSSQRRVTVRQFNIRLFRTYFYFRVYKKEDTKIGRQRFWQAILKGFKVVHRSVVVNVDSDSKHF